MPTSLTYIVLSTRGCSPWRPDAVMSTAGRDDNPVPRIFKGRRERTGHRETCGALPTAGPYLRLNRFQGGRVVKKKRELFPGPPQTSPISLMLPYIISRPGSGILTRFPFDRRGSRKKAHFRTEFPYLLGSTNPCPIAVHMEPFSTSVFKVLI